MWGRETKKKRDGRVLEGDTRGVRILHLVLASMTDLVEEVQGK